MGASTGIELWKADGFAITWGDALKDNTDANDIEYVVKALYKHMDLDGIGSQAHQVGLLFHNLKERDKLRALYRRNEVYDLVAKSMDEPTRRKKKAWGNWKKFMETFARSNLVVQCHT